VSGSAADLTSAELTLRSVHALILEGFFFSPEFQEALRAYVARLNAAPR